MGSGFISRRDDVPDPCRGFTIYAVGVRPTRYFPLPITYSLFPETLTPDPGPGPDPAPNCIPCLLPTTYSPLPKTYSLFPSSLGNLMNCHRDLGAKTCLRNGVWYER